MRQQFKRVALVLVLALLAQPLALVGECLTMPAQECPALALPSMHCEPAARLQAERECCNLQSAPAAPAKAPATESPLAAAATPVKAPAVAVAPLPRLPLWADPASPALQNLSQTQSLLCVFLI